MEQWDDFAANDVSKQMLAPERLTALLKTWIARRQGAHAYRADQLKKAPP